MANYVNQSVRDTATFTVATVATDPTTLTATVLAPDGTSTLYTYGTDSAVVKDSTGVYHIDVLLTAAGTWVVRWQGTGAAAAATDSTIVAEPQYAPNPLDVVTLDETKRALNISFSDTSNDSALAVYITAVSQRLDDYAGPIVQRTVTEVHDGGTSMIVLRKGAAASITSITEYRSGVATTLTYAATPNLTVTDSFMLDPTVGVVRRYQGSGIPYQFWPGSQNIIVTYVAGRATSTATVAALFKEATLIMVRKLWSGRGAGAGDMFSATDGAAAYSVPSFALPNAVVDLVGHLHVPGIA